MRNNCRNKLLKLDESNYKRLESFLIDIKSSLIDSDGDMYLTVASLIEINDIITGSNKANIKLCGFGKLYMDGKLIENKLCQVIFQYIERKLTPLCFSQYS